MVERVLDAGPARGRAHRFTGPWRYIGNMLIFVTFVAAILVALYPAIESTAMANIYINGAILSLLALGVLYTFHQTFSIGPAASWLREFQVAARYDSLRRPPALIAPMATLLAESPGRLRISAASGRSMLDSVGARMSEAGEVTRYLARLLIFLGLLGTFWGLLQTVGSLVDTVNALSGTTGTGGEGSIDALFAAISEPLAGMGTAFSSSIFGLAGSLILGFLDLQATQAQNRFYNEVEDWMASISRVGVAEIGESGGGGASTDVLIQTAENMDSLVGAITRSEDGRARTNEALSFLATELSSLNDRLGRQESALTALKERALDDTLSRHVRSIDVTLQRLSSDSSMDREQSHRELRAELRALSTAITAALEENSRRGGRN